MVLRSANRRTILTEGICIDLFRHPQCGSADMEPQLPQTHTDRGLFVLEIVFKNLQYITYYTTHTTFVYVTLTIVVVVAAAAAAGRGRIVCCGWSGRRRSVCRSVGVNPHSCLHVLSNLMLLRCCCWSYCVYCVLQFLSVGRPVPVGVEGGKVKCPSFVGWGWRVFKLC